jgi:hypothetical protein
MYIQSNWYTALIVLFKYTKPIKVDFTDFAYKKECETYHNINFETKEKQNI